MTDFSPLFEATEKKLASGGGVCLVIDGVCASGKSTLAEELAKRFDASVIHTDDFYLPPELRTEARFEEPGGNIDYERFSREVSPHLRLCQPFVYRRFDCGNLSLGEEVTVLSKPLIIVEGAYSMNPKLGVPYNFSVGLLTSRRNQLLRIELRDGEKALKNFEKKWIPLEEKYLKAFDIFANCDFVFET